MNQSSRIALVLGATGGVGGETARALVTSGWRVKALTRHAVTSGDEGIEWLKGDAMLSSDVRRAAEGAQVIVHAVNPPGYKGWERLVLPMVDNTIAAAREVGARILLPGSVYLYGADVYPLIGEDAPQHPPSRKGEIRVDVEARLQRAALDGVRSLVLRCGDFYGPYGRSNWLAQGIVKPDVPLRVIRYPGPTRLRHAWAYLPDVASTFVALLEREEQLDTFARFHFPGHALTGDELAAIVRRVSGEPSLPMRPFPWWMVDLASPFVETMREVRKMRYLWNAEVLMDGARLRAFLPGLRETPPEVALKSTLEALGVLRA